AVPLRSFSSARVDSVAQHVSVYWWTERSLRRRIADRAACVVGNGQLLFAYFIYGGIAGVMAPRVRAPRGDCRIFRSAVFGVRDLTIRPRIVLSSRAL